MNYQSLQECVNDLEKNGHLIRITEQVDPNLEMAAIQRQVYEQQGPAVLFENIKGCEFPAVSNLFGTIERSKFIFRKTFTKVQQLIELKNDPIKAIKNPIANLDNAFTAFKALPKKSKSEFLETTIDKLPQIKCWQDDGGAFITLPQVYSEDPEKGGIMNSNLGMYRIQLSGNDYVQNKEIGLHYQIHRGIGVHQSKANKKGVPLKVSIFVGGPPAHTLAAVMPLPEGISEMTFGGALAGRRFRYFYKDGYCISSDADFVITGEIHPNDTKPEGPFGDHLGYYSLKHDFPVMKVHKVYHKKDAIWPFTIVGRPPQEDTSFGALIHEIAGAAIQNEIPGLHTINAVDAAGVHPLLLAIGSERYTPYTKVRQPQELLTIANHILGKGQLSLAKYLLIVAKEDTPDLDIQNIPNFFKHLLERVDWKRDLHFQTNTTIDTLDYSGTGLNTGSKVVIAAVGEKKRELSNAINSELQLPNGFSNPKVVMNGVLAIQSDNGSINELSEKLKSQHLEGFPLIVVVDDADFTAKKINNFLWVTFTRSNPSHDIYGVDSFTENKHWGCKVGMIIDSTIKKHHAPPLIEDAAVEKRASEILSKYLK
jgi:4-hydroxy-3-polyprenylbenzoate decarboxylase